MNKPICIVPLASGGYPGQVSLDNFFSQTRAEFWGAAVSSHTYEGRRSRGPALPDSRKQQPSRFYTIQTLGRARLSARFK